MIEIEIGPNGEGLQELIQAVSGGGCKVRITKAVRTDQQRKALELYCKLMAEALEDAGFTYTHYVAHRSRHGVKLPWTQERFKDSWRLVQGAVCPETKTKSGRVSTVNLSKDQVSTIYDHLSVKYLELTGVSLPFPSEEELKLRGLIYG